ncbi:hypothetical protein SEA_MUSETTA_101 [Microbacterium phage Musetta]|nr:hypothetical protein SEA_MUSETTA_101 [Microbacterium phage Musetta]
MNTLELPGLAVFEEAMHKLGRTAELESKNFTTPAHTVSQARREQLHTAAVKRRRKRKKGGPK